MDLSNSGSSGGGSWTAGPWGGDGVMYGDPEASFDSGGEPLPSTSFGEESGEGGEESSGGSRTRKHRKSKSYANISDYERGRRRESAGYRRSRASGDATNSDMFMFSGSQTDPAGRDSLRQSRGYNAGAGWSGPSQQQQQGGDAGRTRADSHFQSGLLPNRSFPNNTPESGAPQRRTNNSVDLDNAMPLDSEPHLHSPQRQSIGPEDEELYAGRSLALYPFEPENSNELRLREGQVIMVSYRHGQGWLVAEDPETGEQGLVPEEYVRLLSELPHYDEATGTFLDAEGEDGEVEDGEVETSGVDMGHSEMVVRRGDEEADEEEDEEEGGTALADEKAEVKDGRVDEAYQRSPDADERGDEKEQAAQQRQSR
jgi:hypothetical protein